MMMYRKMGGMGGMKKMMTSIGILLLLPRKNERQTANVDSLEEDRSREMNNDDE